MATASSLGCGPPPTDLARRRLIFSQQVGPSAGCASERSRSRPTRELLSSGRKLHTVPSHVPCWPPLNRAAAEAKAGRAQRPLEAEGPHSAAANLRRQPCHLPGRRQLASGKPTGEFKQDIREGNAQEIPEPNTLIPRVFRFPFLGSLRGI